MKVKLNTARKNFLEADGCGIGWCCAVRSPNGRVWATRNEGEYDEPLIDGKTRPSSISAEDWWTLAAAAAGVEDKDSLIEVCTDVDCDGCPYFLFCEVWDSDGEEDDEEDPESAPVGSLTEEEAIRLQLDPDGYEWC